MAETETETQMKTETTEIKTTKTIKIVVMSDTHSVHNRFTIPEGDIFIHAGDFTRMGSFMEITEFNTFLKTLPHKHKIIVAGNHDFGFERLPEEAQAELLKGLKNCYYLQDSSVIVEGITFYGSPWQPKFHKWAFNLPRGKPLKEKWDLIPNNIDILITHGPPKGILDKTIEGERVGCEELLLAVLRVKPKIHIFGHIHEGRGIFDNGTTKFINASNLTASYRPANDVMSFEYTL